MNLAFPSNSAPASIAMAGVQFVAVAVKTPGAAERFQFFKIVWSTALVEWLNVVSFQPSGPAAVQSPHRQPSRSNAAVRMRSQIRERSCLRFRRQTYGSPDSFVSLAETSGGMYMTQYWWGSILP